jgi:hypothetical protein
MKQTVLLVALGSLFVGCAHHDYDRSYVRHEDRVYVSEEHPRAVIVDDERVYIRDSEGRGGVGARGSLDYQNNMEPRVRGKHAEALGWNTENYYYQRGYR